MYSQTATLQEAREVVEIWAEDLGIRIRNNYTDGRTRQEYELLDLPVLDDRDLEDLGYELEDMGYELQVGNRGDFLEIVQF